MLLFNSPVSAHGAGAIVTHGPDLDWYQWIVDTFTAADGTAIHGRTPEMNPIGGGNWSVVPNNGLSIQSNAARVDALSAGTVAASVPVLVASRILTIAAVAVSADGYLGVVLNSGSDGTLHARLTRASGALTGQIYSGGSDTVLASVAVPGVPGATHELRVDFDAPNITLTIDAYGPSCTANITGEYERTADDSVGLIGSVVGAVSDRFSVWRPVGG